MHSPPHPSDSPQRRPTHDGVQRPRSGVPEQVSPGLEQAVPGLQVPPHPSLGVLPQGRVGGAVQVGAQRVPARQVEPIGHVVPFRHAGQSRGSMGSTPHMRLLAGAQAGQHTPPMHVDPGAPPVPTSHLRQTAPAASRTSGIRAPHGNDVAGGHGWQHEPLRHSSPPGACRPCATDHVWQTAPHGASTSGMGTPQGTPLRGGHDPQDSRAARPLVPRGLTQLVP
jgi:hypothetical protein